MTLSQDIDKFFLDTWSTKGLEAQIEKITYPKYDYRWVREKKGKQGVSPPIQDIERIRDTIVAGTGGVYHMVKAMVDPYIGNRLDSILEDVDERHSYFEEDRNTNDTQWIYDRFETLIGQVQWRYTLPTEQETSAEAEKERVEVERLEAIRDVERVKIKSFRKNVAPENQNIMSWSNYIDHRCRPE